MFSISPCWIYLKTIMCKQQISVFHKLMWGFMWVMDECGIIYYCFFRHVPVLYCRVRFFWTCTFLSYAHICTRRTASGCFHHRRKCPGEDSVACMKVRVASHRCALSSWVSRCHPGYSCCSKPVWTDPMQRHPFWSLKICPFNLY